MKCLQLKSWIGSSLCYLTVLSLFPLLSSCVDTSKDQSSDTGAISFNVVWHDDTNQIKGGYESQIECGDTSGVEWVQAHVYDENNNLLLSGPDWPCSDRTGTLEGVKAGSGRMVVIFGWDGDKNNILYQGQAGPVTVTTNQTESVGTIDCHTFVPQIIDAAPSNQELALTCNSVNFATSYNLYWSTVSGVSKTDYDGVITGITSTPYIHTDLTNETTYYYIATAVNDHGESGASDEVGSTPMSPVVSTLAGTTRSYGSVDGIGAAARFSNPQFITTDGTHLFVCDTSNYTIRKIVISTGEVTTLAGTAGEAGSADGIGAAARFYAPDGIATDGYHLYVADTRNHTIRRIVISTGEVTTLSGSAGTPGSDDGVAAAARFNRPTGITMDWQFIYVVDTGNHTIRTIEIFDGDVATLAGTAGTAGATDGIGTAASFNSPSGIAIDGSNLYVSDTDNGTIRAIEKLSGEVTTLAGTAGSFGSDDGAGTDAKFYRAKDITSIGANLYVADLENHTIRRIVKSSGIVSTIAGSAELTGAADGTGENALFFGPAGITTDGTSLYVAEYMSHTIRKITISTALPRTTVSTLAGTLRTRGSSDGIGTAASFYNPDGICYDGKDLYVSSDNNVIRKIVIATGEVTTIAGTAEASGSTDGIGAAARFDRPNGITADEDNLYISDQANETIRKIVKATGEVTTIAGSAGESGSTDGIGAAARFNWPKGIAIDGINLYVADNHNHTIRKIVISTGEVTTFAGTAGWSGSIDADGTEARFTRPLDITTDGTYLYVTDIDNHAIRKIDIATRQVTTLAGNANTIGATDGAGDEATFDSPNGITLIGNDLYVSDIWAQTIRKIDKNTGDVTTLAGTPYVQGSIDGIGSAARFSWPSGIATDGINLYIPDAGNDTIRMIQ